MIDAVALIPARAGSERIPGKNIRPLAGRPLIAYTIAAARQSGCFSRLIISTDSEQIAEIAADWGIDFWARRPPELATAESPDIEWVEHALSELAESKINPQALAILRPTSPFRSPEMIRRAFDLWRDCGQKYDSLRAVQPVREHPGKMWRLERVECSTHPNRLVQGGDYLRPISTSFSSGPPPTHSRPTQTLPPVYVQNASLEIAWTKTVLRQHSISGFRVMPFFTQGWEGFDLNTPADWLFAEFLIDRGLAVLPVCSSLSLSRFTKPASADLA